jgi:hypothetical protein
MVATPRCAMAMAATRDSPSPLPGSRGRFPRAKRWNARRYIVGETATLIGDVQPEQPAIIAGGQRDRATAVPQRVGDEVIQRLRCAVGITEHPAARRHVADHDLPASGPGGGPRAGPRRLE